MNPINRKPLELSQQVILKIVSTKKLGSCPIELVFFIVYFLYALNKIKAPILNMFLLILYS